MGTPNARQEEFLEVVREQGHNRVLYGGARGPGKSWGLRRALVERCLTYPMSSHILLRRSFPELRANHINRFLVELPHGSYTYNSSEHMFRFPNGSRIVLGFVKNDVDLTRYQGHEYDTIAIDEGTMWREWWFDQLAATNRTTKPKIRPLMLMGANPGGIGHVWVKRRWVDREFEEQENPAEYTFIAGRVYDNTILMLTDPGYVSNLEAIKDPMLRRAWLDGDWDVFSGQYFSELRRDVHGYRGLTPVLEEHVKGFRTGQIFRMGDYGLTSPSAIYWAVVDTQGEVWIYRELYEAGLVYSALAKRIRELTPESERVSYTVFDPSIFGKERGTGVVGAEQMSNNGVSVIAGDNNRIEGWRLMQEYIGAGRIHVHLDGCPKFWSTVPALIHDERNVEDLDTDGEDHSADAVRYGLMSRPRRGVEPKKQPDRMSSAGLLERARRQRKAA